MKKDSRLIVKNGRPGTGKGLFAAIDFKKKEFVAEYTGKKITTKQAEDSTGRYLFEIDEDWTIDAGKDKGYARYINHCCVPNVEAEIEDGHINIYTTRKIIAGEEFTIDYGEEYYQEFIRPKGCKCSAKKHQK